jgi:hypothetical protein
VVTCRRRRLFARAKPLPRSLGAIKNTLVINGFLVLSLRFIFIDSRSIPKRFFIF